MDWISAQLWKDTLNPSSHHLIASSNWFKALQALAPVDSKIFEMIIEFYWIDSFVVYVILHETLSLMFDTLHIKSLKPEMKEQEAFSMISNVSPNFYACAYSNFFM